MNQIGALKVELRKFLADSQAVTATWDAAKGSFDIRRDGGPRGMELIFPEDAMTEDGDPMTAADKQALIGVLTTIVDEHNANQ